MSQFFGGKGQNLMRLRELQVPVPSFTVITVHECQEIIETGSLPGQIMERIQNMTSNDRVPLFSVRSSATAEDGVEHSFAGLFKTLLDVPLEELFDSIVEVFSSVDNPKVIAYLREKSLLVKPEMAVIVQEMIHGDWAGVAFSRKPVGDQGHLYLEACPGIGAAVVDGEFDPLRVELSRFFEVLKIDGPESVLGYELVDGIRRDVNRDLRSFPESLAQELGRLLLKLEVDYKSAVDVEWAFKNNEVFILQCRPVTSTFMPLKVFTDFNIIESYPGTLSRLSFEFVRSSYELVFNDAVDLLGFSRTRKQAIKKKTNSLVESHWGHVYYHLNNYYFALDNLPGGVKNRISWHRMIGGQQLDWVQVEPVKKWSFLEYLRLGFNLSLRFVQWFAVQKRFAKDSRVYFAKLREQTAKASSYGELMELGFKRSKEIKGWGWTVINDLIVMVLTKLLEFQNRNNKDFSISEVLKTGRELESLKPLRELQMIRATIADIEEFKSEYHLMVSDSDSIYSGLQTLDKPWSKMLFDFLSLYGDRSFEELKLESLSFKQQPLQLMELICHLPPEMKPLQNQEAEFKGKGLVIALLRRSVAFREELRLQRGVAFGWLRETLYKAYQQFVVLYKQEDMSYTNFLEYSFDTHLRLSRGEIDLQQFLKWRSTEPLESRKAFPSSFYLPAGEPTSLWSSSQEEFKASDGTFKGLGASPGYIEAPVLIVSSPQDVIGRSNLSEYILVTLTTDPAWVYLMAQCKGLISEKGSLLSHTAIIGRELGIPTVVGVQNIFRSLENGEMISLDGQHGIVQKLDSGKSQHEGLGPSQSC